MFWRYRRQSSIEPQDAERQRRLGFTTDCRELCILGINVALGSMLWSTQPPNGTAQQIIKAFLSDTAPRYLLQDRDAIYRSQFRKLLQGMRYSPRIFVTDKLRSYGAAKKEIMPDVIHQQGKWENTGICFGHPCLFMFPD